MSKIFAKTVKKTTLWSVILAIVVAAAIVVCALFGFNKDLAMKDSKSLTVSLNAYVYNTKLDEVKEDLTDKLDPAYVFEGAMSGDVSEVVFVFKSDVDVAAKKADVESYLQGKVAEGGAWATAKYSVSVSAEKATAVIAEGYVLRAAIAGVVLAVLAFVYVSLRYKLGSGLVAGVSVLLSMLLTAALVVLTRVYVTGTAAYAITVAGLLTAAMILLTFNNIRDAKKDAQKTSDEIVSSSVAVKENLYVAVLVAVGMILMAVLGGMPAVWFAASALLAICASLFVSLFFAPAMYLSVNTALENKPSKKGYVGAKKTSSKTKKAPVEAPEEEAEAPAEAPVEEAAEEAEAPAEEPVEEAAEEAEVPVEEPVEEVVEEAEAPAEEPVEEVVEETEVPVEEAPAEEATETDAE